MRENVISSTPYPANYFRAHQAVHANIYRENGQNVQQKKIQSTADSVHVAYSSATEITYDRSLSLNTRQGDEYDLLRELVLNMFQDQGTDLTITTDIGAFDAGSISPEKAQELIAEDGYFGVEKTSERIFTFAVGMTGGDPAKIDGIRQGVERGFQEALDAFGGWLPDISHTTYDTVMKKIDKWAAVYHDKSSPESQTQVKS